MLEEVQFYFQFSYDEGEKAMYQAEIDFYTQNRVDLDEELLAA